MVVWIVLKFVNKNYDIQNKINMNQVTQQVKEVLKHDSFQLQL